MKKERKMKSREERRTDPVVSEEAGDLDAMATGGMRRKLTPLKKWSCLMKKESKMKRREERRTDPVVSERGRRS